MALQIFVLVLLCTDQGIELTAECWEGAPQPAAPWEGVLLLASVGKEGG